jgi:hypothetical protein
LVDFDRKWTFSPKNGFPDPDLGGKISDPKRPRSGPGSSGGDSENLGFSKVPAPKNGIFAENLDFSPGAIWDDFSECAVRSRGNAM